MDSSFQQPHAYMRPPQPPPHTTDPHHHFHQMPPPPPRQPAPPQGPWYSSQFQYHHRSQTPSPPPQWPPPPPPPHTEHYPPAASYPPPPPPANYTYHPNQFHPPPPPPHSHARPHAPPHQFSPHSHIPPQPYPQEWSNPSWPPNQGYSANKNEEDWAAKARAWADAKAAMESQHQQSPFAPAGRVQEQSHYHDQYQQSVDSRYTDVQNQSHPSSTYQQFSYLDASAQRLPGHSQDAVSASLETSYTSDGYSYGASDGTSIGDPSVSFEQGNLPTNSSVHQQEVPSSYSSVTGKEAADQIQQPYSVFPLPISSSQEQQHGQPSMQATFASAIHSVDPAISLADQPLDFAPRFSLDGDMQMQTIYSHHDTSMNNWAAPVAPAASYPLAPGSQHDPSFVTPGHAAPPFGRFPGLPGPGLPPTIPPTGAPFALTTGTAVHPTAVFSADPYGISGVPERPKKASVPNWLREEIKKKVIAAPSVDHPKEDTFMEDGIDKSHVKGDETDSKSIDSYKSAEDEDDEEDLAEAARTAAINQEIKRVLTEVLLKVTDELFDEIATKVLTEDDLTAEVGHNAATSNHKASTSPPSAQVPKASAKVLVPVKAKELENDGAIEKSNSSSHGDVLGLGNYGSDADDGDDEIESSTVPVPSKDANYQSKIMKPVEDMNAFPVNSSSQLEEQGRSETNLVDKVVKTSSLQSKTSNGAAIEQLHHDKVTRESNQSNYSQVISKDNRGNELNALERSHDKFNGFNCKDTLGTTKSELPGKGVGEEKAIDDHLSRESRKRSEKNDRHDRGLEKDFVKEVQVNKAGTDEKGNESHRRKDERHKRKEKTDYSSEAKEKVKEHNSRHGDKSKESESRKRSSRDVKDDKKEAEKPHRSCAIEDTGRRKEHTKDKEEHKSRQKDASNSDRHRRKRSTSVGSRHRTSKDRAVNHSGDSSGEDSDGSKRKLHSRKRDLSPSPVRSKRRQVSRSPHSKRSQRRHSPYSSLDNSRRRRSRSRSPVRRQR